MQKHRWYSSVLTLKKILFSLLQVAENTVVFTVLLRLPRAPKAENAAVLLLPKAENAADFPVQQEKKRKCSPLASG